MSRIVRWVQRTRTRLARAYWNEPRQLLGTAIANNSGGGALNFTIPANAARGPNIVVGVGQTSQAIGVGGVDVQ